MSKLILTSDDGQKKVIETPDGAYWALRIKFLFPKAQVSYKTSKGDKFWPDSFCKVGLKI